METERLIYEDIYEALGDVIRAAGGYKKVGSELRPELGTDKAGVWLKDCMNPDRREKLDPEQVILLLKIGRRLNCHAGMRFMAQDVGYEVPRPTNNEDRARQLVDVIADMQRTQAAALAQLTEMAKTNPGILKAVA